MQKEKVTNKRISEVSGLSERTVLRCRQNMTPKIKNMTPQNDSPENMTPQADTIVTPQIKQPISDAFKHFLKRK